MDEKPDTKKLMVRTVSIPIDLRSSDQHHLGLPSFCPHPGTPCRLRPRPFTPWLSYVVSTPAISLPPKWLLGLCHSPVRSFPSFHLLLLQTRLSRCFLNLSTSSPSVELLMEHSALPATVGLSCFFSPCTVVCSCNSLTQKTEPDYMSSSPTRMSLCKIKYKTSVVFF